MQEPVKIGFLHTLEVGDNNLLLIYRIPLKGCLEVSRPNGQKHPVRADIFFLYGRSVPICRMPGECEYVFGVMVQYLQPPYGSALAK